MYCDPDGKNKSQQRPPTTRDSEGSRVTDNKNTPLAEDDISPRNKKKRKADRLAELRLLVTQTREGLGT